MNEIVILVSAKDVTGAGFASAQQKARGFGTAMGNVGRSMADFGAKATTRLTLPIVAGFGLAERAATNLSEAQNAVNVVFGESSRKVLRAAQDSTKLGMSQRQLLEAVTPIGSALQNAGFSADQAADASLALTERAADMASVFNTDVDSALVALQAGLRGEADPLERFGVGLNEAAVQAKAVEMGLGGTGRELTANEKQQARLALIMEQTNKISGDFARTSEGNANQLRIQKARAEDAAAAFGQGLQPVMAKLLETGAGLLSWFGELSPAWQQFIIFAGLGLAALGPLLAVIGNLIVAIKGIAAAFSFVAANPIILVIAAIIAAIVLLIIHWDKVKAAALAAWDFIWSKIKAVWEWIKRNWPLLVAILTGPIGIAVLAIVRHWDTIRRGFSAVKQWIGDRVGEIVRFIMGIPGRIATIGASIAGKFHSGILSLKRWIGDRVNDIVDFFWSIPERLVGLGRAIFNKLKGAVAGIDLTPGFDLPGFGSFLGHGGITGAQAGGARSGLHLVGEHGPEVVRIPGGSHVYSNAMTRGMLARRRGGGDTINLYVAGSIISERDLMKLVRDALSNGGLR